ncbi:MAG: hypothetical protein Q8P72_06200 [Candidatus Roizmanbacteria bacterium]|nr:hypothetical protein [Candidatus Roizmanbacteria bacterium]
MGIGYGNANARRWRPDPIFPNSPSANDILPGEVLDGLMGYVKKGEAVRGTCLVEHDEIGRGPGREQVVHITDQTDLVVVAVGDAVKHVFDVGSDGLISRRACFVEAGPKGRPINRLVRAETAKDLLGQVARGFRPDADESDYGKTE